MKFFIMLLKNLEATQSLSLHLTILPSSYSPIPIYKAPNQMKLM